MLNIKQAAARRLNKQATCFCKRWICSSFFDFSCQPASSCTEGPVSEPTGSETLFHFWFPAQNPVCSPPHWAATIYKQLSVGSRGANLLKLSAKRERVRGDEQMNQNGTGQSFFFFFFQYQRKKGNQNAPSLPKVVPYYTLMYAHKHSLTHTQTQSHAPSIVIRGKNMIVIFLQLLLWECPSFVVTVANTV